jgi:hypothetical protein
MWSSKNCDISNLIGGIEENLLWQDKEMAEVKAASSPLESNPRIFHLQMYFSVYLLNL